MSRVLLVARRELLATVRSPLGAVVVAGALLGEGLYFYWQGLTEKLLSAQVLFQFFYGASGATMIAALALSMRLVAEERQTGTLTLLNTAPIKDWEIVAGKFLSAFAVIVVMALASLYMPLLILVNGKVSAGHIAVGYAGLLLLGAATTALGLFASALARSQVVAVMVGVAMLVPLLLLWAVARAVDPPLNTFLAALALHHENQMPFMRGILELGPVAYYLAVTWFFLLAATKTLEARRWR
ncbi:MAG: ABC transporter permease [Sorangiineae bacterium]|nr:ABC transporter permease [Polyangiaceae bacterium]MEB2323691.1 ABC transporter permease [Sorangiineae bacterium]